MFARTSIDCVSVRSIKPYCTPNLGVLTSTIQRRILIIVWYTMLFSYTNLKETNPLTLSVLLLLIRICINLLWKIVGFDILHKKL